MLPVIIGLIPSLFGVAEKLIPHSSGSDPIFNRKTMILGILGHLWDAGHIEKLIHDFPGVNEKKMFLDICGAVIDNLPGTMAAA